MESESWSVSHSSRSTSSPEVQVLQPSVKSATIDDTKIGDMASRDIASSTKQESIEDHDNIHSDDGDDDGAIETHELLISTAEHSDGQTTGEDRYKLRKELTVFNAVTIVVGQIIGSGIFITPTIVLGYTGSFGLALICWTIGGVIAIGGGLSYAELGTLLKTSGGEYSMLREGYSFRKKHPAERLLGDLLGFLAVWCIIVLEKPGSLAVASLTAGKYLSQVIAGGDEPPDIAAKLLAISFICKD